VNRLLIATTNPAKLAEYRILLRQMDLRLETVSLAEVGIAEAPEETGKSFRDNAMLKARFYFERAGIPTLADDGGLEVDALGGAPGLHSHRWLGVENPSDRALAEEVIRRMEGVEKRRRSARIRAAIAITYKAADAIVREVCAEAAIEGLIAPRSFPEIRKGFPYRAVLWLPERACYLAELGDDEEARISQRRTALIQLREELQALSQPLS